MNILQNVPERNKLLFQKNAKRVGNVFFKLMRYFLLIGLSFLVLYPILYLLSVSFRTVEEMYDETVIWLPKNPTLIHYGSMIEQLEYFKVLGRTVLVVLSCVILQLVSCSITAYSLARYKFKGVNVVFLLAIFTFIVLPQTAHISLFSTFRYFDFFGIGSVIGWFTGTDVTANLINTHWPLILSAAFGFGLRSGLYIYVFREFFKGMPTGLEEAASIDGCGTLSTYLRIIVPNAIPVFVMVGLLTAVDYWNDNTVTGIYLNSEESFLLINNFEFFGYQQIANRVYGLTEVQNAAGAILTVLPLLLIYIVCQKFFVECMDRSGIKG